MLHHVYKWNVMRMAVMQSSLYFMTFLIYFQLKYLQGNIYENACYCGVSDALAIIFATILYTFLGGLKPTYVLSFLVSCIGALGILHIENNFETDPTVMHPPDY